MRKHDDDTSEIAQSYYPITFRDRRDKLARLDPHFAKVWQSYLGGLLGRPQLDRRTRLLTLVGQYAMRRDRAALGESIDAALLAELKPREILEVIFQCYVYGGELVVLDGVDVFLEILERAGRLDELEDGGLPEEHAASKRDGNAAKATWSDGDRTDPRLPPLLAGYGWERLSDGLRLRPGSFINLVSFFDVLDPPFLALWLDAVWSGMYGRRILDDKTRILCIVANCIAVGDTFQYTRHMQGALRAGATPKELLELVLQSCLTTGHPLIMGVVINDLMRLLDDLGVLEQALDDPTRANEVRRIVKARIAMRSSVKDLSTSHLSEVVDR